MKLLESLQPRPEYMRLVRAIVIDVWEDSQKQLRSLRAVIEKRLDSERRRLEQLEEALIYRQEISHVTYERQRKKLDRAIAEAETELSATYTDDLDVDGLLTFAESVFVNAASLWRQSALDQKQRLQRVFFPEGLLFDGTGIRTTAMCLAFSYLLGAGVEKDGMASPTGFEPVFWP